MKTTSSTIGLVLSGGGVKGLAHVGILEALNQRGVYPGTISGCSAGALVGALYANGISPQGIIQFFKDTPLFSYSMFTINKPGFFDPEKYLPFFGRYFKEDSFESLQVSLYVVATNMMKGECTYFSEGELLRPLLASAALPPVFSPIEIEGDLYSDGGVMNNFPVEPLVNTCDYIIGSYTTSLKTIGKDMLRNSIQISQRSNSLMLYANSMDKLNIPDLLFKPGNLESIGILDKKGIDKAYVLGYDYANFFLDRNPVSIG